MAKKSEPLLGHMAFLSGPAAEMEGRGNSESPVPSVLMRKRRPSELKYQIAELSNDATGEITGSSKIFFNPKTGAAGVVAAFFLFTATTKSTPTAARIKTTILIMI